MSENVHPLFPAAEASSSERPAPILPVEQPIVSAALAAERVRQIAEQYLYFFRGTPRNAELYERLESELWSAWTDLATSYRAYREVLDCKGQA